MPINIEILKEFQAESKKLLSQMNQILSRCEGDFTQVESLAEYGNNMDRIMGAAKSLGVDAKSDHLLNKVGDYAAVCKAVAYKSSQIEKNVAFYDVCVALLMDVTEVMEAMLDAVDEIGNQPVKGLFPGPFLDRLKWVSSQFEANVNPTIQIGSGKPKLSQIDIDSLVKKLGLD